MNSSASATDGSSAHASASTTDGDTTRSGRKIPEWVKVELSPGVRNRLLEMPVDTVFQMWQDDFVRWKLPSRAKALYWFMQSEYGKVWNDLLKAWTEEDE